MQRHVEAGRRILAFFIGMFAGAFPIYAVQADVVASPTATPAHRPTVDAAPNGVPIVQITTPSGAGVSRNQYQTFNVDPRGVVLNNSGAIVQTQQAGWIDANPNLVQRAPARIILNEVTSTNPSSLRGYAEVAGSRAEVVIANPNGITCDGCGFINTSRGTLTTGTPMLSSDGNLSGFRVTDGRIDVQGDGLNATNVDQLDLLARSISINTQLWANDLNVITGSNQVDYASLGVQVIQGEGDRPTVAIDVSALGGMYANRIRLLGTEAGVGVASAGTLYARAGDIRLDSQGQVTFAGDTNASGNIAVSAADGFSNSGVLHSLERVDIATAGAVQNSGLLAAQGDVTLGAGSLVSSGVLAAGLNASGELGTGGNLSITTGSSATATGQNLAGGSIAMSAASLNLTGSRTRANDSISLTATAGGIDSSGGSLRTSGAATLNATADVVNNGGEIGAASLTFGGAGFYNRGGTVTQFDTGATSITVSGLLDNTGGVFVTNGNDASLRFGTLINDAGGSIAHAGSNVLALQGTAISNQGGSILSNGEVDVIAGSLDNRGGVLNAGREARVDVTGDLRNNGGGYIGSNGAVSVNARNVDNSAGAIYAADSLDVQSSGQILNNDNGLLRGDDGIAVSATGLLENRGGRIETSNVGAQANVAAQSIDNTGGSIYSQANLAVTVQDGITNDAARIFAQGNLTVTAGGTLSNNGGLTGAGSSVGLTVGAIDNSDGLIISGTDSAIRTGALTNGGGTVYAATNLNVQSSGAIDNAAGLLRADGNLALSAVGAIGNQAGNIEAGGANANLNAASLDNTGGTLYGTGNIALGIQGSINNSTGTIFALGDLSAIQSGASLNNTEGTFGADGNVRLTLNRIENTDGLIVSGVDNTVQAGTFTNMGGSLAAQRDLTLDVANLTTDGEIIAGRDATLNLQGDYLLPSTANFTANRYLTLSTTGDITNQTNFTAVGGLTLRAANIDNQAGALINSQDTTLEATLDVTNSGRIEGDYVSVTSRNVTNTATVMGDYVTVNAQNLTNQGAAATIASTSQTSVLVQNNLVNRDGGLIYSLGDVVIAGNSSLGRSRSVLNESSLIEADGNLWIAADDITNRRRVFETEDREVAVNVVSGLSVPPPITPGGRVRNVTATLGYTESVVETVVTQDSPEGQILSGGSMFFDGAINNFVSTIAAGGNIDLATGSSVNNVGRDATRATTQNGQYAIRYQRRSCAVSEIGAGCSWRWRTQNVPYFSFATEAMPGWQARFTANQAITGNPVSITNTGVTASNIPRAGATTLAPVTDAGAQAAGTAPGTSSATSTTSTDPFANLSLPTSGLYTVRTGPDHLYLVETDPRFANYGNFISSDYMLSRLGIDPEDSMKRLGDGFYEQRLVASQILQLTGRRLLENYADSEEEFIALMEAGIAVAEEFDLQPGMRLSAEQMASLTHDIVWMEERTVGDEKVLVPIVYLSRTRGDDMDRFGALMAADVIDLKLVNNLTNAGLIQATTFSRIEAQNILNDGGTIQGGEYGFLTAREDIVNRSGTLAGGNLVLEAGRDVKIETLSSNIDRGDLSTTLIEQQARLSATQQLVVTAGRDISLTGAAVNAGGDVAIQAAGDVKSDAVRHNERVAVLFGRTGHYDSDNTTHLATTINAGGNAIVTAGNDIALQATTIEAGEQIGMQAGRDITLTAVNDSKLLDVKIGSRDNYVHERNLNETVRGTALVAGGDVTLIAGSQRDALAEGTAGVGSITMEGSAVVSRSGTVALSAGKDIVVKEVMEQHESLRETKQKDRHIDGSESTYQLDRVYENRSVGSLVAGDSVAAQADRDIVIQGSAVSARGDAALIAGRDVNVLAAQSTSEEEHVFKHKESGFSASFSSTSATVGYGSTSVSRNETVSAQTASGSIVSSTEGSVYVGAEGTARVVGSDIVAGQAIDVVANDIVIDAAAQRDERTLVEKASSSGITMGFALPGFMTATSFKEALYYDPTADINEGKTPIGIQVGFNSTSQSSTTNEIFETARGSSLTAGSDVTLIADKNNDDETTVGSITVRGSSITSESGNVALMATGDVNIVAARETYELNARSSSRDQGLIRTDKVKTKDNVDEISSSGSLLSGVNVGVFADRDIAVEGSAIVANQDVLLSAKRDVTLTSVEAKRTEEHVQQHTTTGIFQAGNFGVTLGKKTDTRIDRGVSTVADASTVGTAEGRADIEGRNILIKGSDVVGASGISVVGEEVTIEAALEEHRHTQINKHSEGGITLSLTGAVIDMADQAINAAKRAVAAEDDRLAAVNALRAGQLAYNAYSAASSDSGSQSGGGSGSGINFRLTIGGSSASSQVTQTSNTARVATLTSQGDIDIRATGRETDTGGEYEGGDLTLTGAVISGRNVGLFANRDLTIQSAEEISELKSKNRSASGAIGLNFGTDGIGIYVGASYAAGKGKGNTDTHIESTITASETLSLESGRDTVLRGAVAKGETIFANVGRDLTLQSQQDIDDYHSQQLAVAASATIGAGVSVSASVNFSKTDSEYKSVIEQTGLWAGDGGFDIYVGNHTNLDGAVIASTADPSKNRLSTGTLSYSDIKNSAEYEAISVGVSVGGSGGMGGGMSTGVTPSLSLPQQGDSKSVTRAAISAGTIDIRDEAAQQERTGKSIEETLADLSRDPDSAHKALKKIFDGKKVEEQMELSRVFGEVAFEAVGDLAKHYTKPYENAQLRRQNAENYLELKEKEAAQSLTPDEQAMLARMESGSSPYSVEFARNERAAAYDDITRYQNQYDTWKDGSTVKIVLHGFVGAVQAGLGGGSAGFGALAAASGEGLNTFVSEYLANNHPDLTPTQRSSIQQLSAFLIGATAVTLAGGDGTTAVAGGIAATQGEAFNRRLHESEIELIQKNKKRFAQLLTERLGRPVTEQEAEILLGTQAMSNVDSIWAEDNVSSIAQEFLVSLRTEAGNTFIDNRGQVVTYFDANEADRNNHQLYVETRSESADFYRTLNTVLSWDDYRDPSQMQEIVVTGRRYVPGTDLGMDRMNHLQVLFNEASKRPMDAAQRAEFERLRELFQATDEQVSLRYRLRTNDETTTFQLGRRNAFDNGELTTDKPLAATTEFNQAISENMSELFNGLNALLGTNADTLKPYVLQAGLEAESVQDTTRVLEIWRGPPESTDLATTFRGWSAALNEQADDLSGRGWFLSNMGENLRDLGSVFSYLTPEGTQQVSESLHSRLDTIDEMGAEQAGQGNGLGTAGLAGARSVSGFGVFVSDMAGSGVTLATDGETQLGFLRQLSDPMSMITNGWDAFVDSPTDQKGYTAITMLVGAPRLLRSAGVPDQDVLARAIPNEPRSMLGEHNENMFGVLDELSEAQRGETISSAPATTVARLESRTTPSVEQNNRAVTSANSTVPANRPSLPESTSRIDTGNDVPPATVADSADTAPNTNTTVRSDWGVKTCAMGIMACGLFGENAQPVWTASNRLADGVKHPQPAELWGRSSSETPYFDAPPALTNVDVNVTWRLGETDVGTSYSYYDPTLRVTELRPTTSIDSINVRMPSFESITERVAADIRPALGDLRQNEIARIQETADALREDIYVVGSAARGARRNLDTDLPLKEFGDGPTSPTRSDIDYVVARGAEDHPALSGLPDVDPSFGVRGVDYVNLNDKPAIRFRPGESPEVLPPGTGRIEMPPVSSDIDVVVRLPERVDPPTAMPRGSDSREAPGTGSAERVPSEAERPTQLVAGTVGERPPVLSSESTSHTESAPGSRQLDGAPAVTNTASRSGMQLLELIPRIFDTHAHPRGSIVEGYNTLDQGGRSLQQLLAEAANIDQKLMLQQIPQGLENCCPLSPYYLGRLVRPDGSTAVDGLSVRLTSEEKIRIVHPIIYEGPQGKRVVIEPGDYEPSDLGLDTRGLEFPKHGETEVSAWIIPDQKLQFNGNFRQVDLIKELVKLSDAEKQRLFLGLTNVDPAAPEGPARFLDMLGLLERVDPERKISVYGNGETTLIKEAVMSLLEPSSRFDWAKPGNLQSFLRFANDELKGFVITIHMDAGKALEIGIKGRRERLLLPSEANYANVQDLIKLANDNPNVNIIWAHAGGLGRSLDPAVFHPEVLRDLFRSVRAGNLYIDMSWDLVAKKVTQSSDWIRRWAGPDGTGIMNEFPDRFVFGTDSVATSNVQRHYETLRIYQDSGLLQNLRNRDLFLYSNARDLLEPAVAAIKNYRESHRGELLARQLPGIWEEPAIAQNQLARSGTPEISRVPEDVAPPVGSVVGRDAVENGTLTPAQERAAAAWDRQRNAGVPDIRVDVPAQRWAEANARQAAEQGGSALPRIWTERRDAGVSQIPSESTSWMIRDGQSPTSAVDAPAMWDQQPSGITDIRVDAPAQRWSDGVREAGERAERQENSAPRAWTDQHDADGASWTPPESSDTWLARARQDSSVAPVAENAVSERQRISEAGARNGGGLSEFGVDVAGARWSGHLSRETPASNAQPLLETWQQDQEWGVVGTGGAGEQWSERLRQQSPEPDTKALVDAWKRQQGGNNPPPSGGTPPSGSGGSGTPPTSGAPGDSGATPLSLKLKEMDSVYRHELTHGSAIYDGKKIKWFTPQEREAFKLEIREGKIYDAKGRPFDTTNATRGQAIFIMDERGDLYAIKQHKWGEIHHSSLSAGGPVAGAGELTVRDGELKVLTDFSGHYSPEPEYTQQVLDLLKRHHIDVTKIKVEYTGRNAQPLPVKPITVSSGRN